MTREAGEADADAAEGRAEAEAEAAWERAGEVVTGESVVLVVAGERVDETKSLAGAAEGTAGETGAATVAEEPAVAV